MPKLDHKDLGDALSFVYLPGLVTAVYAGDKDTPESQRDTADVSIKHGNTEIPFSGCPIFYHCDRNGILRDNGSIENASRGFSVGDEAICRCHIQEQKASKGKAVSFDKVILVGHLSGPKRCSYKYAFLRISSKELKELKTPLGEWTYSDSEKKYTYKAFDVDSHKDELCVVYDSVNKKAADIIDPSKDGTEKFVFPCSVETLKPFLDSVDLTLDTELYTWSHQGSSPDSIEFASAYPNHTADFSGDHLGVNASGKPYESYYADNPVQALFTKFTNAVMTVKASEITAGKFSSFDVLKKASEDSISDYASRSGGFLVDVREKEVSGATVSEGEKPQWIIDEIARLAAKKAEYTSEEKLLKVKRTEQLNIITELDKDIQDGAVLLASLSSEFDSLSLDQAFSGYAAILGARISSLNDSLAVSRSVVSRKREELAALDESSSELSSRIADISNQINTLNNQSNVIDPSISPTGERLVNRSYHVQACYGENEYWLCGKNTYMGIVVSYCDQYWKFIRVQELPPTLAIGNPGLSNLSNAFMCGAVIASVGFAVSAIATQALGNNIFDYSMLKRINEGCIHRTTAPAVCGVSQSQSSSNTTESASKDFNGVGSYRLTQISNDEREGDPSFSTAVNSRLEHIDCWNRFDNWHNTIQLASKTPTANPTWHFRSVSNQWRLSSVYIDTPLGSFLYGAPRLQAAVWYMYQLSIQGSTARNDLPFNSHFVAKTKQTGACCMQIYIVQRQSVTAWNEKVDSKEFVRQAMRYGPYDCFNVAENFAAGSEPPAPDIKSQVPSDATYSGDFNPGGGSFGGGGASGSWDGGGLPESAEAPPASGAVGAVNSFVWNDKEKVRFVRKSGALVDFLTLSDNDKASLVEDRFFITSETDVSSRGSFPLSRNEIEIVASFDLFRSLKKENNSNNASKAKRSKDFESVIKTLIKAYYDTVADKSDGASASKSFSMFYFDAKII